MARKMEKEIENIIYTCTKRAKCCVMFLKVQYK